MSIKRYLGKAAEEALDWLTTSSALIYIPLAIVLLGLGTVGVSFYSTWDASSIGYSIDLSEDGIKRFYSTYNNTIRLAGNVLSVIAGVAAVLNVYAAVQAYRVSLRANNLANHGKQLEIFLSSAESFIQRQYRLHIKSVDRHKLYHFLFTDPVNGNYSPSEAFDSWRIEIKNLTEKTSDDLLTEKRQGRFDEDAHYRDIKKVLKKCGIDIQVRKSRAEMFQLEQECYSLLNYLSWLFFKRDEAEALQVKIPKYCDI